MMLHRTRTLLVLTKPIILVGLFILAATLPDLHARGADSSSTALDRLFVALRAAPDIETARKIEQQIWKIWTEPADAELADQMSQVLDARAIGDLDRAMSLLDAMVQRWPDYAEGWNQRATVEYMLGDDEASLRDIARTLELEPRHFGALSGRILIDLRHDDRAQALRDLGAALKIYPLMPERKLFPELLDPATHT